MAIKHAHQQKVKKKMYYIQYNEMLIAKYVIIYYIIIISEIVKVDEVILLGMS